VAIFREYGWGVFVIPFALTMISVRISGHHSPRRLGVCLALGMRWLLVAYLARTPVRIDRGAFLLPQNRASVLASSLKISKRWSSLLTLNVSRMAGEKQQSLS
jgi:hypothetical protein